MIVQKGNFKLFILVTLLLSIYLKPARLGEVFYSQSSRALKGQCGGYLQHCCHEDQCDRGYVCSYNVMAEPVCFTPQCSNTQECMPYAYWTDCVVELMNCNACGFLNQKVCSLQQGPISRDQECYEGQPVDGYCREGYYPPPPVTYYPQPEYQPAPQPEPYYPQPEAQLAPPPQPSPPAIYDYPITLASPVVLPFPPEWFSLPEFQPTYPPPEPVYYPSPPPSY